MSSRTRDLIRVASWAGLAPPRSAIDQLLVFEAWLRDEAIPAGGIGPNESGRIWGRHVLDSALFAAFVEDGESVLDVGSGVGLPGIPLAILRPQCHVTLLDRSGRRCDLARRACRVVRLENVAVEQGDLAGYAGEPTVVVSRASLPPDELIRAVEEGIPAARRVVAAGSRVEAPESGAAWDLVEVPAEVTGETVWLLKAWISPDLPR